MPLYTPPTGKARRVERAARVFCTAVRPTCPSVTTALERCQPAHERLDAVVEVAHAGRRPRQVQFALALVREFWPRPLIAPGGSPTRHYGSKYQMFGLK